MNQVDIPSQLLALCVGVCSVLNNVQQHKKYNKNASKYGHARITQEPNATLPSEGTVWSCDTLIDIIYTYTLHALWARLLEGELNLINS